MLSPAHGTGISVVCGISSYDRALSPSYVFFSFSSFPADVVFFSLHRISDSTRRSLCQQPNNRPLHFLFRTNPPTLRPIPSFFPQSTRPLKRQNIWPGNSQCAKRRLECKYPHTSRRGQRKPQDPAAAAATITAITACKPRAARASSKRSASSYGRI